ncbi:Flp family type IVb pilin [Pigmentiphaga litoralis]|uniref:Flp family type IVb pilin n=1 Tax=Pigmentiphaga litoralis TaxID=516702 RepID=UPI001E64C612|nr:Flp family type IVb pilin [Pigmentiphaga litoralis]
MNLEKVMQAVSRFLNNEEGATAIEYGLIAGLVALGIILALTALGGSLDGLFRRISTNITTIT